jgi:hypothetical protein
MTRLSDTERDLVVDRVQEAYAHGRLSSGEMELRLERALTATSHSELEPVLAGLPDDVLQLGSTAGHITRAGDWLVPRVLRIESEYGRVRLDLSRAVVDHPQIDIELHLTYGSALVLLPPDASANADGARTVWGSVTCKARGHAGRPHVRLSGELGYGHLRIRYARTWRRG